jgi:hypothetical protein
LLPHTQVEPRDDPAFLAVVDSILANLSLRDRPDDVYVVHIDNWFDHKWLKYSGSGVVAFPQGYPYILVAKDPHWQEKMTFPPFTPNRVVAQYLFARLPDGTYEEQAPPRLVHGQARQASAENLHRRVADFSRSGLFVWYSSGSASNRRGSILVYQARDGVVDGWYAGFVERGGWRLDQVKGMERTIVDSLAAGHSSAQKKIDRH